MCFISIYVLYMFVYIVTLFFLFHSSLFGASESIAVDIALHVQNSNWQQELDARITNSFILDGMSFESDVLMSQAEFYYLVDMRDGDIVTADDLKKAASHLFKKNKFETMHIMLVPTKTGKHMHITLKSFWTFERLKLHGWMLGKERYRRYYLLEPGERFDRAKDKQSLRSITEQFAHEGFFNATIESYYDYHPSTKSVTVHALLNKGDQFYIGKVRLDIDDNNLLTDYDREALNSYVYKNFVKTLHGSRYAKEFLNKETTNLHHHLARKGFLHSEIQLQEQVHKKEKTVDLIFSVSLRHKKEFVFVGNKFFSSKQLRNNLLLFSRSAWLLPASNFTCVYSALKNL